MGGLYFLKKKSVFGLYHEDETFLILKAKLSLSNQIEALSNN